MPKLRMLSVADPDFELRRVPGFILLAQVAFSCQSPRSATGYIGINEVIPGVIRTYTGAVSLDITSRSMALRSGGSRL